MIKMKQEGYESMIDSAITWFEDIAEMCSRLTPGNVSHNAVAIRGKATRAAEWLTKKRKPEPEPNNN